MEKKSLFWSYENTHHVHIELSNMCNAACPICPRYINHSLLVNPDLDLGAVSFEEFKTWFPLDFIKRSVSWIFCGTNGDPMMAKDAYEILEYVAVNSSAQIQVNTNGSMRNPDFWVKLGKMFSEQNQGRRYVIFSVDGLEDTNHIYRRNVNWDRLVANMKAYASTGAESLWDFLIFKHNQHQLKDAEKFSREIGITAFSPKRPFGFEGMNSGEYQDMPVYDSNGNFLYAIEQSDNIKWRRETDSKKVEISLNKIHLPQKTQRSKEEIAKKWDEEIEKSLEGNKFPERFKGSSIKCKSCHKDDKKEIYVDCHGNVMPCCFVGTMVNGDYRSSDVMQLRKIINEWGREKINLNNLSLENILDSGYLDSSFYNRWESADDKDKVQYCFGTCGKVDHMERLFVKTHSSII